MNAPTTLNETLDFNLHWTQFALALRTLFHTRLFASWQLAKAVPFKDLRRHLEAMSIGMELPKLGPIGSYKNLGKS